MIMALDIMIVKDVSKPYWEKDDAFLFGEVEPSELTSLFFTDFDVMNCDEYAKKIGEIKSYDDYYSERISQLQKKYPLLVRIKDYYEDAFFSPGEIEGLRREILSLKNTVTQQKSINLLDQLLEACEIASKNDAGLELLAD